ncbi:retinol dehydrogenase 13-like isoform X2 [Engraulis encrasicolus]|uniref:retinol dehydrogenase 13-like isoform X2 n=1 Tax=Engraulis encrasicolus TaxID=184585 RepID=UPI002FD1EAAF
MSKYILPVSVFGTAFGSAVLLKNYISGGTCPSKVKIPGKTVIITGANTGIGKETARELARRGGRIIMGCRDMEKCEAAAREIRGKTLNKHVYAKHIDLSSIKSIKAFVQMVQAGHFLLTYLLLDKLKGSAPSRIINMSSVSHVGGEVDFDDLNWDRKTFDTRKAYSQSKLAIVLFTRELAKRLEGTGVTVNALHPGVVATDLGRHTGLHQSQLSSTVLSPFFFLFVKSPTLGAQSSVYLTVAKELEGISGRYYDVMTEKDPAPQALDDKASERLWHASVALLGLNSKTVSHAHPAPQSVVKTEDLVSTTTCEPITSPS